MRERSEEALRKFGIMQTWELTALSEAMFINGAAVIFKEMTGDRIDDHQALIGACFDVLFFYGCFSLVQVLCKPGDLLRDDIDHKGTATVAAGGTIYLWCNDGIKFLD